MSLPMQGGGKPDSPNRPFLFFFFPEPHRRAGEPSLIWFESWLRGGRAIARMGGAARAGGGAMGLRSKNL